MKISATKAKDEKEEKYKTSQFQSVGALLRVEGEHGDLGGEDRLGAVVRNGVEVGDGDRQRIDDSLKRKEKQDGKTTFSFYKP